MIESEKHRLIRKSVREFAKRELAPLAASIDETGCLPAKLYQRMVNNQYMGVTIPKKYGGCEAGYVAMAIVMEELSKVSVSATLYVTSPNTPGYSVGVPERKMGVCGSPTADIILKDVRVHKSQILGTEGDAFLMAMKTLDSGRLVVAAQCLGIAEAAMEEAVKYVKQRRQFARPLAEFQGLQFMLADMETKICCARALIYDTADKKDAGMNITKEAAAAKYFASELCNEVAAKALQMHGAYGYVKDYPIERIFRDARVTTIYEGTSQILQMVIAKQVLR